MWERLCDARDRLAEIAAAQRRAALARFIRHHQRKTLVLRASPERRLPAARVPDDSDAAGIDSGVGREVVHRTAGAPRPRAKRTPGIARPGSVAIAFEQPDHAVPIRVLVVGCELRIVERGNPVTSLQNPLRGPEAGLQCAGWIGVVGRAVVDEEKDRCRAGARIREKEGQAESVLAAALRTDERNPLQRRRAGDGLGIFLDDFESKTLRRSGRSAVDVFAKELEDFAPPRAPLTPSAHDCRRRGEDIRQGVGRDTRFVEVELRLLLGCGANGVRIRLPALRVAPRRPASRSAPLRRAPNEARVRHGVRAEAGTGAI